jgi:tight adherence protein B
MPLDQLYPFLAVFAATVMAFLAVWTFVSLYIGRRRREFERRLGSSDSSTSSTDSGLMPRPKPVTMRSKMDVGFEGMIFRTGLGINADLAIGIILLFGVMLATVVFIWRHDEEPWLALPAFFVGAAIPLLFFWWRQSTWRRTIQGQMPDAFFLLARSLRAGRSIDQAFQLVGDQGVMPLSREFRRMSRQMDLGLTLPQALQSTARRLDLVDFNIFASVVSLHRTTGGNLPAILDRLATSTRDRNQFERQYQSATVLGRLSAALISTCALVILFYFFFFYRGYWMRYFETTTGITLFVTAISLFVLGALLLLWLVRYQY